MPAKFIKQMKPEQHIQWLWWDDSFQYKEILFNDKSIIEKFLSDYVAKHYQYSPFYLKMNAFFERLQRRLSR